MKTLKEIELRLAAIREECQADGADLDALEAEARDLKAAQQQLLDQAEKRSKLLATVAGMSGTPAVVAPKAEARSLDNMTRDDVIASPEYRSAFAKRMLGKELTDVEKRAWTSGASSAGPAIPTELANDIMKKAHQVAPLLGEITLLHVPGGVTYAVEGETADAAEHTENASQTAASDALVKVTLTGYEVTKYVQVSKTVKRMAIPAFEAFLVQTLGEALARRLVSRIIYGTGSNQATGISKANTWKTGTNQLSINDTDTLTAKNVLDLIGMLPGGYDQNAKFLMSKKTLFTRFLPLQDKAKNDLVTLQNGTYHVQGYPVMLDDSVSDIYLGDFKKYIGNLSEEINVTSDFDLKSNSYEYLGACLFDGKPALGEAFVRVLINFTPTGPSSGG